MRINSDELAKIEPIKEKIEENAKEIDEIVNGIIAPYCEDLDKYVEFIRDVLKDGENPPTDEELDDFCLNLSTLIYFAGSLVENLGIRDDIAKAVYKETYNTVRSNIDKGTVNDKDSLAELSSQKELIISSAYSRAYKMIKNKVDNAQELLSSCKKVLSRRMQEYNLSQIGGQ